MGARGHGLVDQLLSLVVEGEVEAGLHPQAHGRVAGSVAALQPGLDFIAEVRRLVERATPWRCQCRRLGLDRGRVDGAEFALATHGRHHQARWRWRAALRFKKGSR